MKEVGQALLQRHEAYVRRHEEQRHSRDRNARAMSDADDAEDREAAAQDQLDELTKENKALEKVCSPPNLSTELSSRRSYRGR
jgi:hypothetical protein